ncbi:hypothetical protein NPIL_685381 [Nephila pilipes]|uniref:Uncharacterized protein n=1 Tax=Nephila pilipes TaxID=299642 RepID=A0A8X6N9B2_NEPPI|nr:hypothetical protein NPIL_685381 [Nephila pilipes]
MAVYRCSRKCFGVSEGNVQPLQKIPVRYFAMAAFTAAASSVAKRREGSVFACWYGFASQRFKAFVAMPVPGKARIRAAGRTASVVYSTNATNTYSINGYTQVSYFCFRLFYMHS